MEESLSPEPADNAVLFLFLGTIKSCAVFLSFDGIRDFPGPFFLFEFETDWANLVVREMVDQAQQTGPAWSTRRIVNHLMANKYKDITQSKVYSNVFNILFLSSRVGKRISFLYASRRMPEDTRLLVPISQKIWWGVSLFRTSIIHHPSHPSRSLHRSITHHFFECSIGTRRTAGVAVPTACEGHQPIKIRIGWEQLWHLNTSFSIHSFELMCDYITVVYRGSTRSFQNGDTLKSCKSLTN